MNKKELERKIKAVLPKNWKLENISESTSEKWAGSFRVTCPIEDRMGDMGLYRQNIDRICNAVNSFHDGGGWAVGGNTYDNFFYIKKD